MPGRPLAERITRPRSLSPNNRGVDRYVPNSSRRSHSPRPRRRGGGRRAGARRENTGGGDAGGRDNGGRTGRDGRPKKTQEELDAEMEDYFEKGSGNASTGVTAATAPVNVANEAQKGAPAVGDVDMIE
jgi:THO complex subunit 4